LLTSENQRFQGHLRTPCLENREKDLEIEGGCDKHKTDTEQDTEMTKTQETLTRDRKREMENRGKNLENARKT
jgi:hypothetical protein